MVSIAAELDSTLEALRGLETTLANQCNTLNQLANERDLTNEEGVRLTELTNSLGRVRRQIIFVDAAKLEQLDNSPQVKAARDQFQALAERLEEERKSLERLAGTIRDIGNGFAAAEKAVQAVGKKLATSGLA